MAGEASVLAGNGKPWPVSPGLVCIHMYIVAAYKSVKWCGPIE